MRMIVAVSCRRTSDLYSSTVIADCGTYGLIQHNGSYYRNKGREKSGIPAVHVTAAGTEEGQCGF
jgi:hypothetical protein